MMEWKECTIGDLGKIVTGKTPRTSISANYGGDIPFLSPSDDMNHKTSPITNKTITETGLKEVKNCLIPTRSVCVSCIGSDLGKVVMTNRPLVTNQQINSIIPSEDVDPDYVYYLMTIVGKHLNFLSKTSTAVPIINKSTFSEYKIKIPHEKGTQRRIASILSSLDRKIELNNKINAQLEEMAQAIFKSWFVDFEPFKDGKFVESELGMIPEGWRVGTLGELIDVKYGKDHKKLDDGNIPVYGSGGVMRFAEKAIYQGESVLIPRKGTLNNVIYVDEDFWTVDTMFYSVPKKDNIMLMVYLMLCRKDLASMNSGSAVPSMTTDILNRMSIIIAEDSVLAKFNAEVKCMYDSINVNKQESLHLSQLRDTLLPKLMNGEIEI